MIFRFRRESRKGLVIEWERRMGFWDDVLFFNLGKNFRVKGIVKSFYRLWIWE